MERRVTVLLAEDDDEMRRLLVRALIREGHRCIEMEDGFELADYLECVARNELKRPELMVTDVRMPGRTGLEAIERLRAAGLDIPVLLITAFPEAELRERAAELGVRRVLDKPFDIDDFKVAVRSVLDAEPAGRQA